MNIRLLAFEGCPYARETMKLLQRVLEEEGLRIPVERVDVPDPATAERTRFLGSPSVQINGLDIEVERRADAPHFGCRLYKSSVGNTGIPPETLFRDALIRAQTPRKRILFLCTGNSCRSQMAEAWTRVFWGDVLEPFSAGTSPGVLDERAVLVMREAGIDISSHRPKSIQDIPAGDIDFVVTLCDGARETCPVFPGKTALLHQGFDDPPRLAEAADDEETALKHYRRVRDEIRAFVEKLPGSLEAWDTRETS